LYYYIRKLKIYQTEFENNIDNNIKLKYFNLLIKYICTIYISTLSYFVLLLKNCKIIYNLLYILFKLNIKIYTIVFNAKKLICCQYNSSKKRITSSKILYFYIKYCLLDFNKQIFNKVFTVSKIEIF